MKKLFKFRQWTGKYISLYIFQKSRWTIGFTLDVNYKDNRISTLINRDDHEYDWSSFIFSIDLLFIYIELHKDYPKI